MVYKYDTFLRKMKLIKESFDSGIPEVGDYVKIINNDRKKIDKDFALNYLILGKVYKVLDVKKKDNNKYLIDIGCRNPENNDIYYFIFKRFEIVEPPIEQKEGFVYINISPKILKHLRTINDNPISKFIYTLTKGIDENNVRAGYLDYLDLAENEKGMISSIRNDEVGTVVTKENAWTTNRRKSTTFLKTLRRILTDTYMNELDKEWTRRLPGHGNTSHAELFASRWKNIFDDEITTRVLKGIDILKAYNFSGEYKGVNFVKEMESAMVNSSCANFEQTAYGGTNYPEEYEFYIENSDVISILVTMKRGQINGRVVLYEGENLFDECGGVKGKHYKVSGNPYVSNDKGQDARVVINEWLKNNGYTPISNLGCKVFFKVKTKVSNAYTAIDQIYVNLKDDIMCTGSPCNNIQGQYYCAYRLKLPK